MKGALLFDFVDYRAYLRALLEVAQSKNKSFSMRSFAKRLGVSSSNLDAVMKSQRNWSRERAALVAGRLDLREEELRYFLSLHELTTISDLAEKERFLRRVLDTRPLSSKKRLQKDEFKLVSDHRHFCLLAFIGIEGAHPARVRKFAQTLGLNEKDSDAFLTRLSSLGLILWDEKSQWRRTSTQVLVDGAPDSLAFLRFHEQALAALIKSFRQARSDERYSASEWISLSPSKFEKAKLVFADALDKIYRLAETDAGADSVYQISLHALRLRNED